jgi:shikimate dehydrogenase
MAESYGLVDLAPDKLAAGVADLAAGGVRGFSVTVPHKTAVMEFVDRLDPSAELVEAVNAVAVTGKGLTGYNTDLGGLTDSFAPLGVPDLSGNKVLVLGAGGAARAAVIAAVMAGAGDVVIANRTVGKARELAGAVSGRFPEARITSVPLESPELPAGCRDAVLCMNATSLGLAGDDPLPIEPSFLPDTAFVYDLVYSPEQTRWVRQAAREGMAAADGKEMLLRQAARAWSIWFGTEPPIEAMRKGMDSV